MNIIFNENEKSVEIKDGLKTHYWMVKIMMIFNIINSILFLALVLNKKQMAWFGFIWVIIGMASIIGLIYQIKYKTASEKLKLSDIHALVEKQFFGRKRFSLKLKNGKLRDLKAMKNELDIKKTKALFENIGIQIS